MPFGCITARSDKSYNCFSDITDKYDIGELLKEFCEICLAREIPTDRLFLCKKFLKKDGRKWGPWVSAPPRVGPPGILPLPPRVGPTLSFFGVTVPLMNCRF
uniref:Uncharacterized protein n=1 Tax=Xenopus tropicalis TaxID=8364 RepID=A0A803JDF1_XENTR